MTTRKILFPILIVAIFACSRSPLYAQQVNYVFELKDGYFQSGDAREPIHLVHPPPYREQWVNLGEGVHIWYSIVLRQGENNPCDRRSQLPCNTKISFVSLSEPTYSFYVDGDFRIENQLDISYGIPVDRVKTPLGDGKFVWTVEKDGKILFSHEILVKVQ